MKLDRETYRTICFIAALVCASVGSTLVSLSIVYPHRMKEAEAFVVTAVAGTKANGVRTAGSESDTVAPRSSESMATADVDGFDSLIGSVEQEMAKKTQQYSSLETSLRSQEDEIANIRKLIQETSVEVEEAESRFDDAVAHIDQLRSQVSKEISDEVEQEMKTRIAVIRAARERRDTLRREEGARPDRQSEAQLELLQIQKERAFVKKSVQEKYKERLVRAESDAISLAGKYAMVVQRLRNSELQLRKAIEASQRTRSNLEVLKNDLEKAPLRMREEQSR